MKRFFEKISFKQFQKDISNDKELYLEYNLPKRSTNKSAGYDFFAISDFCIKPNEIKKIPTGIKVSMLEDEMLLLFVRSSMGFKYNVRMCNQVGVIDSDYYNNPDNEGHMWIALQNEGETNYNIKKGDKYLQGVFTKFLMVDNDEENENIRQGGLGSTDKESESK